MDISGGAVAAEATNVVIPANSKIVNIIIDLEVAANTTTNISVGDTVGGAATLVNAVASGTTVGIKALGAFWWWYTYMEEHWYIRFKT